MNILLECTMLAAFCLAAAAQIYRFTKGQKLPQKEDRFMLMTFEAGFLLGLARTILSSGKAWMVIPYLLGAVLSYTAILFTYPEKRAYRDHE